MFLTKQDPRSNSTSVTIYDLFYTLKGTAMRAAASPFKGDLVILSIGSKLLCLNISNQKNNCHCPGVQVGEEFKKD